MACENFLDKSVREINLLYLERADTKYMETHDQHSADTTDTLQKAGLIDTMPEDHQTGSGERIIYQYDSELKHWDYKMKITGAGAKNEK